MPGWEKWDEVSREAVEEGKGYFEHPDAPFDVGAVKKVYVFGQKSLYDSDRPVVAVCERGAVLALGDYDFEVGEVPDPRPGRKYFSDPKEAFTAARSLKENRLQLYRMLDR